MIHPPPQLRHNRFSLMTMTCSRCRVKWLRSWIRIPFFPFNDVINDFTAKACNIIDPDHIHCNAIQQMDVVYKHPSNTLFIHCQTCEEELKILKEGLKSVE